jgi:hypothetical protein
MGIFWSTEEDRDLHLVDLYRRLSTSDNSDKFKLILDKSINSNPEETLKIIFHVRDVQRNGDPKTFRKVLIWLSYYWTNFIDPNLIHIPFYGTWKDYLSLFDTPLEDQMVTIFTNSLKSDFKASSPDRTSLAAKYAPSENGFHDKKFSAVSKFAKKLKCSKEIYRKKYISPLRKRLNICEIKIADPRQSFGTNDVIPIEASKKYKNALDRRDIVLRKIYNPKTSVEIIKTLSKFVGPWGIEKNRYIEKLWGKLFKDRFLMENYVCVIDIQGSLAFKEGSISLITALLLSNVTHDSFHKKIFSIAPCSPNPNFSLQKIEGSGFFEQIQFLAEIDRNNLPPLDFYEIYSSIERDVSSTPYGGIMPDRIILFCGENGSEMAKELSEDEDLWESLTDMYSKHNYLPHLILWNPNGSSNLKACSYEFCSYVDGFDQNIFDSITRCQDISPLALLKRAISAERYDKISIPWIKKLA